MRQLFTRLLLVAGLFITTLLVACGDSPTPAPVVTSTTGTSVVQATTSQATKPASTSTPAVSTTAPVSATAVAKPTTVPATTALSVNSPTATATADSNLPKNFTAVNFDTPLVLKGIKITGYTSYTDTEMTNQRYFHGLMTNTTNAPLTIFDFKVIIQDKDGKDIESLFGEGYPVVIEAGTTVPWAARTVNLSAYESVTMKLDNRPAETDFFFVAKDFTVSNLKIVQNSSFGYDISGDVNFTATGTAHMAKVYIVVYLNDKIVFTTDTVALDNETLKSGESASFKVLSAYAPKSVDPATLKVVAFAQSANL